MRLLSIVIPAYNEEASIGDVMRKILAVDLSPAGFRKEVIVVNDGSKDRTAEIARSFAREGVVCYDQVPNQGKGRAVQRGIDESAGDYVLIQDADLEYEPLDYLALLDALRRADVVYGSRTLGQLQIRRSLLAGKHPDAGTAQWFAGWLLTLWTFLLYGCWITDTLTAYKLYPAVVLKSLKLRTHGFETDHEITAHLLRRGLRIVEVPIAYYPRSKEEGKKIRPRDGFIAVWTLLRCRFS